MVVLVSMDRIMHPQSRGSLTSSILKSIEHTASPVNAEQSLLCFQKSAVC